MRWSFVLVAAMAAPVSADVVDPATTATIVNPAATIAEPPGYVCDLPISRETTPSDIALPRRGHGWVFDGEDIDFRGGQATGFGVGATGMIARGRLGLIGEVGVGVLASQHPTERVGLFASARVGGRVLVTSFEAEDVFRVSLALDAGVGVGEYWLRGVDAFARPNVFAGWTSLIGGSEHAMQLSLRLAASPKENDAAVLRAVCRGPCSGVDDAPADFTIMIVAGVMSW
jgi:hypothetical protein